MSQQSSSEQGCCCRVAWLQLRLPAPGGVLIAGPGSDELAGLLGQWLGSARDCLTHVVTVDCSEVDSGSLQRVQRHLQPLVSLLEVASALIGMPVLGSRELAGLLGQWLGSARGCLTHAVTADCSEVDSGSLQRVQRHLQPLVSLLADVSAMIGMLIAGPGSDELASLLGQWLGDARDCLTHVVTVDCLEVHSGSLKRVQRHLQPLVRLIVVVFAP